jgi:hypothetical protein
MGGIALSQFGLSSLGVWVVGQDTRMVSCIIVDVLRELASPVQPSVDMAYVHPSAYAG